MQAEILTTREPPEVGQREQIRAFLRRVGPQSTHSIASRYGLSFHQAIAWLDRCAAGGMIRGTEHDEKQFTGGMSKLIIWEVR